MVRRIRDMQTEPREPYFLDPYETLVGIADVEGEPKPAYAELGAFVKTAARIDLATHALVPERTAIVVPDERYKPLPDLAGLFGPRSCLQAFIAAKRAHLPVAVIGESDAYDDFRVLVVPSAFTLVDETWTRLAAFVQAGGSVVVSYGGGDAPSAACELFGIEFLGDGGPRGMLSCRVAQPDVLGALEGFDEYFDVPNHALLSAGTATVVATDDTGNPLLTVNQVGQGRAVFVAVPVERAIAQGDPWATPASVDRLVREVYGAVARAAGCGAPVACDAADVEVALLQGDADDVLVLVNHAPLGVRANVTVERRVASIADVRGGSPVAVGGGTFGVPLKASGVAAFRLTYG
jgi:endo-1,4-beta-mannosidase